MSLRYDGVDVVRSLCVSTAVLYVMRCLCLYGNLYTLLANLSSSAKWSSNVASHLSVSNAPTGERDDLGCSFLVCRYFIGIVRSRSSGQEKKEKSTTCNLNSGTGSGMAGRSAAIPV